MCVAFSTSLFVNSDDLLHRFSCARRTLNVLPSSSLSLSFLHFGIGLHFCAPRGPHPIILGAKNCESIGVRTTVRLHMSSNAFFDTLPRLPGHSSRSEGSTVTQISHKLDSLLSLVQYIQDQSDEAISLGDQAKHGICELVIQISGIDSRLHALETSTIYNTSSTSSATSAHAARIPRELSVIAYMYMHVQRLTSSIARSSSSCTIIVHYFIKILY